MGEWGLEWLAKAVVEAIVSAVTLSALGALVWLVWFVQGRRLWRLRQPTQLTVAVANSVRDAPDGRAATGEGQIRALTYLAPALVRSYRKLDLLHLTIARPPLSRREYEGDLLLLGGPINNKATERVLQALKHRLPGSVGFSENTLLWNGCGSFEPERDEEDAVLIDYGLIVRARNPMCETKGTVILLAGCHTPGTAVAAKAFLDLRRPFWRRLPAEFVAVAKGRIDGGVPHEVCIVAGPEKLLQAQ